MIKRNLERIRRRAGRLLGSGPIVLMYHHVGTPTQDPWELAVSPDHFQQQMDVLSGCRSVMSLSELARRHETGDLPKDAAVVTFDDGYASNLHLAKPILERSGVPATVFALSGFLDNASEPWWDELTNIMLGPTTLPEELVLSIGHQTNKWRGSGWSPPRRREVHDEIQRLLLRASAEERRAVVDMLAAHTGYRPPDIKARRIVTTQELIALADGDLVEIGAHTVTHPWLPSLDDTGQRQEIQACKDTLEALLGRPVRGLAYPFGEHDSRTISIAADLNISYACTTAQGFVHPSDSLLRLPRFMVRDWDEEEFARRFAPPTSTLWIFPRRERAEAVSVRGG